MPKSTKRFTISDSTLNKYGFRLLTAGADLEQFRKNPIMLFMHTRSFGQDDDQVLPLGYWDDIQIQNDNISAVPVFDDNDEFAMKIYDKVENDIFRMASAGVEPLAFSEDEESLLPGQQYATVSQWKLCEASIVDIGANDNAMAFYNNGNLITLKAGEMPSFIPKLKNKAMTKLTTLAALFNLSTDADEDAILKAVNHSLNELSDLKKENEALKESIGKIELAAKQERINRLIETAVAEGRILANQKEMYAKLAANDFETTETLLKSIPAYKSVKTSLDEKQEGVNEKILKMSWDELDKANKLFELKAANPEAYREKFKEKFGKEPTA